MERYRNNVQDQFGNAIESATIEVRDVAGGALTSIFSDDGVTALANPFTAQDGSEFFFYAQTGRYDVSISGPTTDTIDDVLLYDPAIGGGGAVADGTTADAIVAWDTSGAGAWSEVPEVLADSDGVVAGVLRLVERAADLTGVAGRGQLWVFNSSPNVLRFTDDADNIFDLLGKVYRGTVVQAQAVNEATADNTSGFEIMGADSVLRGAGYNSLPRVNISGGNETFDITHQGAQFFYNEATARSLILNNDADIPVDAYASLRVGPSGGTLTIDGGAGVTLTYWDGAGYTTTAAAANITAGEGQYTIWKNTDTNYFIDGPNLS